MFCDWLIVVLLSIVIDDVIWLIGCGEWLVVMIMVLLVGVVVVLGFGVFCVWVIDDVEMSRLRMRYFNIGIFMIFGFVV